MSCRVTPDRSNDFRTCTLPDAPSTASRRHRQASSQKRLNASRESRRPCPTIHVMQMLRVSPVEGGWSPKEVCMNTPGTDISASRSGSSAQRREGNRDTVADVLETYLEVSQEARGVEGEFPDDVHPRLYGGAPSMRYTARLGSAPTAAAVGSSPSSVYASSVNLMSRCRRIFIATAGGTFDWASIVASECLRLWTTTTRPRASFSSIPAALRSFRNSSIDGISANTASPGPDRPSRRRSVVAASGASGIGSARRALVSDAGSSTYGLA